MKAFILAMITLFGTVTYAADAGCGLGAVIIQRNSKGLQLLAWTTNGLLFTQPLGIISGTSECTSRGLVSNDRQVEYFVEVNHDDLSREMAQGEGEKLNVLAQLNGCMTKEAQAAFAGMTQGSFEKIVPNAETKPQELVQNLKKEISESSELNRLCQIASR